MKASERPELQYKVTILNSAAINAFALPNGQLYLTRGLVALANDKSELASVLAHEMGHVIARHAEIREEQARDDAVATRAISDVVKDPDMSALSLAKSKLKLATFSRAQEFEADGIGVGITARAGFDPYGAARMLTALQRNANLASPNAGSDLHTAEFLSSHPATDDRVKNALANARQFAAPGAGERDRAEYLAGLDGLIFGEDSSEGFVRGRRFLHAKLGFTFMAPPGFTLDNTAQAVLGLKDGGREALRVDVVSVPAEQSLSDYLVSGWMENVAPASVQAFSVNGFPAATATAAGKDWSFRLYTVRFGSDVYRFIFAAKIDDAAGRPRVPRIDRQLPPHEPEGKRRGEAAAPEDRHGRAKRHGAEPGATHGGRRSQTGALPDAQRPRPARPGEGRQQSEDGGGVNSVVPAERACARAGTHTPQSIDQARRMGPRFPPTRSALRRTRTRRSSRSERRPGRGDDKSALAALVIDREFARHVRTPEIERILRLVVGRRPALVLRDVVDVAGIFREAAPRVAHVVEVI